MRDILRNSLKVLLVISLLAMSCSENKEGQWESLAVDCSSFSAKKSSQTLYQVKLSNGKSISAVNGSILDQTVEAIVNAANTDLYYGGGVAAAIVQAAPEVQALANKKLKEMGVTQVQTGDAVVTESGSFKQCRNISYIINSVGPRCPNNVFSDLEKSLIKTVVFNTLNEATKAGIKSVAIPPISAGIFGCGHTNVDPVIAETVVDFLQKKPTPITEVILVDLGSTAQIFAEALKNVA